MQKQSDHKIFVAYSRKDLDLVDPLIERLSSRGIRVHTDLNSIDVGENWKHRLETLIREADTIIFAITPSSMSSEICKWEVEYAESQGKRILPVLLKSVTADIIFRLGSRACSTLY
jgi:hypothetical protein